MKIKNRFVFGAALLVAALLFSACPETINSGTDQYKVTAGSAANGKIQFSPAQGAAGTSVTVYAFPEAGYYITELKANDKSILTGAAPWEFNLNEDVTLTAKFEKVPAGNYTVTIAALKNGNITATPPYGPAGTSITLTLSPTAGYWLQEGSLKYNDGTTDFPIPGTTFTLPAKDVTVTAVFATKNAKELVAAGTEALADQNYNAAIDAFESAYQQDHDNKAAVIYSSLAKLASIAADANVRSLMSDRLGFTNYPGTIGKLIAADWMETYTNESMVGYYYENDKEYSWFDPEMEWDASLFNRYGLTPKAGYYYWEQLPQTQYTLVAAAKKTGPLDSYVDETLGMVSWYNYNPNNNYDGGGTPGYYYRDWNTYAYIFVSGTQQTGPLDGYYDEDFGGWVYWHDSDPSGGSQSSGYYWSTARTYTFSSGTPQYNRGTELRPGLSTPSWFKNTGIYKDNLTSAGALQAAQWPLLFYANLLDKNQDGLNNLLDAILSSVFGSAFEAAADRYKTLSYGDVVEVDEKLIEALGLTEVLEGDDIFIGKAELDLLFSAVRLYKASLEWVAAYDWNTDLSFLKTDWAAIADNIATLKPGNLPFGNNFMKDRNNGMMAKSKADFTKALTDAVGAYEHFVGAESKLPAAYVDELKAYGWLKDGLSKLKDAVQNGGTFYAPEETPSGSSYTVSAADALIGINMGKLFTPGHFAIDKLIEAEPDGKAPKFYSFDGDDSQPVTDKTQMNGLDESSYIGFKFKLTPLKEVVVKGLEDEFGEDDIVMPLLPASIGKDLYGLYHK